MGHMARKFFGHIPGQPVGTFYPNRRALADAGVHPPLMQGIHGTAKDGADSIVVSGGYADDEDHGDFVVYTGAGGNDPSTKRQIADQSMSQPNNAGLITSQLAGLPVRLTRGAHPGSAYAPPRGFRYDGLFAVMSHWVDTGRHGFKIVRFRLEQIDGGDPATTASEPSDAQTYATTTVVRRVRDSAQSRFVKGLYAGACQICGVQIPISGGRLYSEGAHIRPLGRPHVGPDHKSNILCLCPNHHAQLDNGGLVIDADLTVRSHPKAGATEVIGKLTVRPGHRIDLANLEYLREHVFPE